MSESTFPESAHTHPNDGADGAASSPFPPVVVRELLHTRMRVTDMEQTVRFYTEVIGLSVCSSHRSPRGSELVFLDVPGSTAQIELCSFPASGAVTVPEDLVHLAFLVDDMDATVARLAELGVPVTDGPTTSRSGQYCFIDAPDGYEIEFIERRT